MADVEGKFAFNCEWFDAQASLVRQYLLFYYDKECAIEMYDVKNRRTFLKKTPFPNVTPADLYIGATVTIYGRQLKVSSFGDARTARALSRARQRTFALVKPHAVRHLGAVLDLIHANGLVADRLQTVRLSEGDARSFYAEHEGRPFFPNLTRMVSEGNCVAMELVGPDAVARWRGILGDTDPAKAQGGTVRARFGEDVTRNAAHGSDSERSARRELAFFFGASAAKGGGGDADGGGGVVSSSGAGGGNYGATGQHGGAGFGGFGGEGGGGGGGGGPSMAGTCHADGVGDASLGAGTRFHATATFERCSLLLIKPHAVISGHAGKILEAVAGSGFGITAVELFHLDRASAEEFLEVYKGVVPEFPGMVDQLTAGPCIAAEVVAEDAVPTFRTLCGPPDPEIARHIRPNTLRAVFGKDKIANAVHCTDLPEDGTLEVEYFFKILHGQ